MKQVSRYLARILRHDPRAGALILDNAGWAPAEAVIEAVARRFGHFDRAALEDLVRTNDKQRYAFDETGTRIRANQGHSIPVDLGLEPVEPPPLLFHGTKRSALPLILREGLRPGRRRHVHLSADIGTARSVGDRRSGETAILTVRSGAMHGHLFFRSANGVWLIEHVPPQFITAEGFSIPPR
ncbi:MAG TPA: RNA 2'-phosphotransferase [Allosphingosinicella sp.]|jgi:putative RNA 2'-phosphotransferase|uniref:RNA 2'-phosphotransferase n=1 Tax=Allosphingosinicella sp. TaxID=2823234 RepID=UPI002F2A4057